MSHLTPAELVDLADGSRDDASMPHLAVCDACRRELADLRAMVVVGDLAAAGDVPEPSPLFWDHLSARVRDGVRNEDVPVRGASLWSPLSWLTGPRVAVAAVAFALAAMIAAGFGSRLGAPGTQTAIAPPPGDPVNTVESVESIHAAPPALLGSPDDPSLSLVADYGGTLEWDELREQMAVSAHTGGMDATVGELSAGERQELRRLLKQELARPAARTDRL